MSERDVQRLAQENLALQQRIAELEEEKLTLSAEQHDILAHVKQGIFTFGRELKIDASYSRAACELFGRPELFGLTLSLLLGESAPPTLVRYLRLLFDAPFSSPRLLERMNPLRAHRYFDATGRERVVSFSFARIMASGDETHVEKIMVVMDDCTELHRLNQMLEQKNKEQWAKLERAYRILTVPRELMRQLLCEAQAVRESLESCIEEESAPPDADTLRALHSLKGNARSLGLDELARHAHDLEEALSALSLRASPARFAVARDQLTVLSRVLSDGDELFARFTGLHEALAPPRESPVDTLFRALESLAQHEAESVHKRVALLCVRHALPELDPTRLYRLRSALVQLVRNAVHHGIEDPGERARREKHEIGSISLSMSADAQRLSIVCTDDGRGIDTDLLVQRAIDSGLLPEDERERLSENEALNLIFQPGLSSSSLATFGSGRGLGMQVVTEVLEVLRGSLEITSRKGLGTEFRLSIPVALEHSKSEARGGGHEHLGRG